MLIQKIKQRLKAAISLAVAGLILTHSAVSFAEDPFFDETFGNYQEELEAAREDGKKGVFIFGAVLDNHKWGYYGTYEKESFKQT